jgi:hypothetical protein
VAVLLSIGPWRRAKRAVEGAVEWGVGEASAGREPRRGPYARYGHAARFNVRSRLNRGQSEPIQDAPRPSGAPTAQLQPLRKPKLELPAGLALVAVVRRVARSRHGRRFCRQPQVREHARHGLSLGEHGETVRRSVDVREVGP